MVHFNELKITPNGKHLIIDVSVLNESYYDNVYLDSIVIDNQDTFTDNGPSSTPIYEYTIPDQISKLTKKSVSPKHVRLNLGEIELGTLNGLYFIYVRTKGMPSPETPCDMDNVTTLGVVTNMYPFYHKAIGFIRELASNCIVPQGFIDYILRLKALELAVKTGNYTDAVKYFNNFFSGKAAVKTGGCGCGTI